jgi:hypothetical protein
MARQRNVAPGFFRNEDLGECSPLARLLFAGLWCWADRLGRVEDRPRRLKAEILPYDEADGEALVAELTARGFLRRYESAGVKVIQIVNFEKYQKPHPREAPSTLPDEAGRVESIAEGSPKADPGQTLSAPREDPGPSAGEPQATPSPASSLAFSLSHSLDPGLASLAGGRARAEAKATLGPLAVEVVAAVSAGVGLALRPLKLQDEADELERRIAAFGGGAEEAIAYFARTCRSRDRPPNAVKVLLLMLRDLDPEPHRAAGVA